jgi:hypothetical protein
MQRYRDPVKQDSDPQPPLLEQDQLGRPRVRHAGSAQVVAHDVRRRFLVPVWLVHIARKVPACSFLW